MALVRTVGASILIGAAAVLIRRALQGRPEWYDEPLRDHPPPVDRSALRCYEDDLLARLLAGEITRDEFRQELEWVAVCEAYDRPCAPPAG
jgi:hypothetical protein